jgi:hypothetical protein
MTHHHLFPIDDELVASWQAPEPESIEATLRRTLLDLIRPSPQAARLMSEYEFWQGVTLGVIKPAPWVKIVLVPNGNA